jgi:hypothetical protein
MSDPTPATKIVIVSGQEFSVPADTDVEAIRSALKGDFPDIATATIQKGTREIAGVTYETVEFVKRAGTKGLGAGDLAQLLRLVPSQLRQATGPGKPQVLRALLTGQLTASEAVAQVDALLAAIAEYGTASWGRAGFATQEVRACVQLLDTLQPVAAPCAPRSW